MREYDESIGDALALVNVVRQRFGRPALTELPDAYTGNPSDCLFYRGLADIGVCDVGADSMSFESERTAAFVAELWGTHREGNTVSHPQQVTRVISAFDSHKISHYEV